MLFHIKCHLSDAHFAHTNLISASRVQCTLGSLFVSDEIRKYDQCTLCVWRGANLMFAHIFKHY